MSLVVPTIHLSSGQEMPVIGLGTFLCECTPTLSQAIKAAVKSGYRHFDCAYVYQNEDVIGQALKESIAESGGNLKREDFFIVSKCWNTFHSKEKVSECLEITLKRLQMDYVDLYLIHWPMGFKEGTTEDIPCDESGKAIPSDIHYTETYPAMEELITQGKTKSIGLSNFNIEQIKDILSICKVKPVCNQFELNPYLSNNKLVEFCKSQNIAVVAYAPLGSPHRPWRQPDQPIILENEVVLKLAKKYNKTPAQIVLSSILKRNIVVIPKSITPSRIEENFQTLNFNDMVEEDFAEIQKLNHDSRFFGFEVCDNHKLYPFKQN